jgi:uncharacterized protein YukJ
MPLNGYGVLVGRPIERRLGTGGSPHFQVHLIDDQTDYRIAINVLSSTSPSEVEYIVVDPFMHPIIDTLRDRPTGFHALEHNAGAGGLDFIRGNLFDRLQMRPLPITVPGPDNDLNDKLDGLVQRAMADSDALIYAFGQRWGPENNLKDKYFGFLPGNGIHDIHMNQGNVGQFVQDDGVWQDGGLTFRFPAQDHWVGIFLKFQSQTWHTDDTTGHQIGDPAEPTPVSPDAPVPLPTSGDPNGLVRIIAAMPNSIESPEIETVTLLNASPTTVNFAGWTLIDKMNNAFPLSGALASGAAILFTIAPPMQLSNKGGTITLLDDKGLKVDGVAYTKAQASNPGWTVVF